MRIGLPRALLYYRYGRFWECFLKGLGAEVVVSRKTDESLLNKGVGCVSSEVCLPIKIVAGHLLELAGEVDAIFFPRIVWMAESTLIRPNRAIPEEKLYACPKMIGIVDIARMLIGDRVRLIAPAIKGNFVTAHLIAGLKINPNPIVVWQAFQQAKKKLSESRSQKHAPSDQTRIGHFGRNDGAEGPKQVGLIGHFYNIQEDFISRAIIETFKENGYQIITKEELPQNVLLNKKGFASKIRWVYERELYNAFEELLTQVEGFCVIVSMGCGPDSLVAEFMQEEAQKHSIPFLLLVIDEHTGTAGLVTRVEAFIELLRRRPNRAPDSGRHHHQEKVLCG